MALSVISKPQEPNNNNEIEEIKSFPQFDVVSDASDHYFNNCNIIINNNNNNNNSNSNSSKKGKNKTNSTGDCNKKTNLSTGAHKKVMQEWKILEKNLPDSIYVRVYENRIDLLRAVIIGAAGTPYHDGLYFFDIAFPYDYPTRPPLVHYRSFGYRINPNLYGNGRVCLSLINTWEGKKSEKWNPNESTVLQVVVSIQALVLNERPYFNEPGTGMWPGRAIWEKKSNAYNEDVFVLSCKTMLFLLRKPPKNFEDFVRSHFRERGHVILSACNAYVNGHVRVGYFCNNSDDDGSSCSSSSGTRIDVSCRFKGLMTGQLYSDLLLGFKRIDACSLEGFVEQLKVETKTVQCQAQVVVKEKIKKSSTNGAVARRVMGKLKKVFGLKMICVKKKTS